jgi:hypothetical protein
LGVVAEGFAYVDEVLFAAGAEDEAAAELHWVFAQAALAVSAGLGAFAGGIVVFAKEMQQIGLFQFDGAVGLAVLVNQQGEVDSGFFAEGFRISADRPGLRRPGALLYCGMPAQIRATAQRARGRRFNRSDAGRPARQDGPTIMTPGECDVRRNRAR